MCHLEIHLEDGSEIIINADQSWKASQDEPIRENDLKAGECYDARKEFEGWNTSGFDDSGWHGVIEAPYGGTLIPHEGERIVEQERLKPKEILHTPDGAVVLDSGQIRRPVSAIRQTAIS